MFGACADAENEGSPLGTEGGSWKLNGPGDKEESGVLAGRAAEREALEEAPNESVRVALLAWVD